MQNESFVFHAEYIEDLPDSYKDKYLWACYNYGIHGIEPKGFSELEQALWIKIKRRIDSDKENYNKEKNKRAINNAKSHYRAGRATKEEIKLLNDNGITLDISKNIQNNPPYTRRVYDNDIVSVYENVYENENVYVNEANTTPSESPSLLSDSQKQYGKIIYDLFEQNDLPCNKKNYISFLQKDFKDGLEAVRGISSEDVIEACKNYIKELKCSDSYVSKKYSFPGFVKSKQFDNCLPDKYRHENFIKYSEQSYMDSLPAGDRASEPGSLLKKIPDAKEMFGYAVSS